MMGYNYADIQQFGEALTKALHKADEGEKAGLLEIWDFFEGLLAEGYVADEDEGNLVQSAYGVMSKNELDKMGREANF